MKRKLVSILLALVMCLPFAACTEGEIPTAISQPPTVEETSDGSWAVYWYLCGSDLETNYGCATADLTEMMEVELPENVNVVI